MSRTSYTALLAANEAAKAAERAGHEKIEAECQRQLKKSLHACETACCAADETLKRELDANRKAVREKFVYALDAAIAKSAHSDLKDAIKAVQKTPDDENGMAALQKFAEVVESAISGGHYVNLRDSIFGVQKELSEFLGAAPESEEIGVAWHIADRFGEFRLPGGTPPNLLGDESAPTYGPGVASDVMAKALLVVRSAGSGLAALELSVKELIGALENAAASPFIQRAPAPENVRRLAALRMSIDHTERAKNVRAALSEVEAERRTAAEAEREVAKERGLVARIRDHFAA